MTINERRKIIGYDELDNADVIFVPASMLPLESATEPPLLPDDNDDSDDEDEL